MGESVEVRCPWCGESMEIWIEADVRGTMVRDCEVCCRPWQIVVRWGDDGTGCDVVVMRS